MNTKTKKMSAAVIIGTIFIIVFALMSVMFYRLSEAPYIIRFLYGTFCLGLCYGMSCVMTERIQEIRKGEDDDLDNY